MENHSNNFPGSLQACCLSPAACWPFPRELIHQEFLIDRSYLFSYLNVALSRFMEQKKMFADGHYVWDLATHYPFYSKNFMMISC
jgi:hypothetical protein